MVDKNTMNYGRRRFAWLGQSGVLLIVLLVFLPIGSVAWIAFNPVENIWPHLVATVLPRYIFNTIFIALGVAILAGAIGVVTAWVVTMYDFVGARILSWLLLLPLAVPAYVGAYAIVDFLEYAGPVQSALRDIFGWETSRDYWFPQVRSRGFAIMVLAGALYPYVYLLVRTALREQSANAFEVARTLGAGPFVRFARLGLPLTRPAISAALAIVIMETVSDFGVVSYFSVQTLTTGIFTTWLDGGNSGGAAQIASLVMIFVLISSFMEKQGRARMRYFQNPRNSRKHTKIRLTGPKSTIAFLVCFTPFAFGFLLPVGVLLSHSLGQSDHWNDPTLWRAIKNALFTSSIAAVLVVGAAYILSQVLRTHAGRLARLISGVTSIGYAAPGAVLGVGILVTLSQIDHQISDLIENVWGRDPGLLLTGTSFAIIYAYWVRFFAIGQGAAETSLGRISPSLAYAARSLGLTQQAAFRRVTLPLVRRSVGTALLLVFVDCIKELPATLLLRPFNFNTLSTYVYERASLEQIGQAAPPALVICGFGMLAVILLAKADNSGLATTSSSS